MDGTDIRGRPVPLWWARCGKRVHNGHKSRNAFDESLPVSRTMIPKGQQVILLADRGFGREKPGRCRRRRGFESVIRVNPTCMRVARRAREYRFLMMIRLPDG